jgi:superfamily I DNA/RNA helicase
MDVETIHEAAGPILLLAGPGTGKTHRLAKRIKFLAQQKQVKPEEMTVVTFTSAAAQNMRARLSDDAKEELHVPYRQQPKLICTLHSLGYRVIRENHVLAGVAEDPQVITDDRLRSILVGDAAQLAGQARESSRLTVQCRQHGRCVPAPGDPKCATCETYRAILKACSAVDHDEQVLLACKLLREHPDVLRKYQLSARHLLIDEYQDINAAQFELIRLLADGQCDGLFVVGDDDQSIYSWRGGSPEYIRRFKADFGPDAVVVPLSRSFRCHSHVLEGALAVVERFDPNRLPKSPFEYKMPDGPKIVVHNAPSDAKEAKLVKAVVQDAGPSQDVLVLYPTRLFLPAIVKELRAAQIPFSAPTIQPGAGLPLVATLASWLANPADSLAFRRCLEAYLDGPASGLPSSKARKPEKLRERESAFAVVSSLWRTVLAGTAASLWDALAAAKDTGPVNTPVYTAFSRLLELHQSRRDVGPFAAEVSGVLSPWRTTDDLLDEAASWVEMASEGRDATPGGSVRLMTFQAAKGLEAKVVCAIGLEEGVVPRDDADLSEQARLFFVSMTRAVNELHLFHARKRDGAVVLRDQFKDGARDIARSRFLDALSAIHAEKRFHPA